MVKKSYVSYHGTNISCKSNQMSVQSIFAPGLESHINFVLGQNKSLQIMIASKLRKWICMDHLLSTWKCLGGGI